MKKINKRPEFLTEEEENTIDEFYGEVLALCESGCNDDEKIVCAEEVIENLNLFYDKIKNLYKYIKKLEKKQ